MGLRRKWKVNLKNNLKTNKNENTSYQNLWAKTKAVLREKFIAVNACIKKKDITTGSHRNTKDHKASMDNFMAITWIT